jgi:hypothetical protein
MGVSSKRSNNVPILAPRAFSISARTAGVGTGFTRSCSVLSRETYGSGIRSARDAKICAIFTKVGPRAVTVSSRYCARRW